MHMLAGYRIGISHLFQLCQHQVKTSGQNKSNGHDIYWAYSCFFRINPLHFGPTKRFPVLTNVCFALDLLQQQASVVHGQWLVHKTFRSTVIKPARALNFCISCIHVLYFCVENVHIFKFSRFPCSKLILVLQQWHRGKFKLWIGVCQLL